MSGSKYFLNRKLVAQLLQRVGNSETPDTTAVTALDKDSGGDVSFAKGITVPTGAEAGFAVGCVFIDTDAAAGAVVWINEGSATSCSFVAVGTLSNVIDGIVASTGLGGSATEGTATLSVLENYLRVAKVSVTAAEVKALAASPHELVAAPGANKVIEFVSAALRLEYGSEVFAESGDNLGIKYTDDSGAQVSETIETTGFVDQAADTHTFARAANDAIVSDAASVNQALVLDNLGSEITGNASNDSVLELFVTYRVHDVT